MYKRKIKVLIAVFLGIMSLAGIIFATGGKMIAQKVSGESEKEPKAIMSCYYVGPPAMRDPKYKDYMEDLHTIEQLYIQKKINAKTFEERRAKIEAEIEALNKKYENKPQQGE